MATRRLSPASDHRGFSLVELLVVIAVIGIIASISIPNIATVTGGAKDAAIAAQEKQLNTVYQAVKASSTNMPSTKAEILSILSTNSQASFIPPDTMLGSSGTMTLSYLADSDLFAYTSDASQAAPASNETPAPENSNPTPEPIPGSTPDPTPAPESTPAPTPEPTPVPTPESFTWNPTEENAAPTPGMKSGSYQDWYPGFALSSNSTYIPGATSQFGNSIPMAVSTDSAGNLIVRTQAGTTLNLGPVSTTSTSSFEIPAEGGYDKTFIGARLVNGKVNFEYSEGRNY